MQNTWRRRIHLFLSHLHNACGGPLWILKFHGEASQNIWTTQGISFMKGSVRSCRKLFCILIQWPTHTHMHHPLRFHLFFVDWGYFRILYGCEWWWKLLQPQPVTSKGHGGTIRRTNINQNDHLQFDYPRTLVENLVSFSCSVTYCRHNALIKL